MASSEPAHVLVVAHRTAATPALIEAVRERAARGDARFHLLVPNLADHAEITGSERHRRKEEAEHMLALALPLFDEATGTHTEGSTSGRHDPIDAIEEKLHDEHFDEIIVSTLPHRLSRRLHLDLAHRLEHLGLPITTVTAVDRE